MVQNTGGTEEAMLAIFLCDLHLDLHVKGHITYKCKEGTLEGMQYLFPQYTPVTPNNDHRYVEARLGCALVTLTRLSPLTDSRQKHRGSLFSVICYVAIAQTIHFS